MTNKNERVTVMRKSGITLYGKTLDHTGKLGNYEVHSDYWGWNGIVYQQFSDAEDRLDYLVKLHEKKEKNPA